MVILPLVRTMIDCLYNITAILLDSGETRYRFRASGYKLTLEALDADRQRYGGNPTWDADIDRRHAMIQHGMRLDGFTESEVRNTRKWPTLSGYLRENTAPTAHQDFLKRLTFGFWQEYSGMAHATFQGYLPIAIFLNPKDLPHEQRSYVDAASGWVISLHISRVSAILLCMLTEVQAHCCFDGARINARLHEVWNALLPVAEIKELYDAKLMQEKQIHPA